jgi:hypothetical protein
LGLEVSIGAISKSVIIKIRAQSELSEEVHDREYVQQLSSGTLLYLDIKKTGRTWQKTLRTSND